MTEVVYGHAFKRQLRKLARRYRHIKTDITPVIESLQAGETPGDRLTGYDHPLYKVRAANSDSQRGKSGGYRIIYYVKTEDSCALVTIYSKSDQGDVAPTKLRELMAEVEVELRR